MSRRLRPLLAALLLAGVAPPGSAASVTGDGAGEACTSADVAGGGGTPADVRGFPWALGGAEGESGSPPTATHRPVTRERTGLDRSRAPVVVAAVQAHHQARTALACRRDGDRARLGLPAHPSTAPPSDFRLAR